MTAAFLFLLLYQTPSLDLRTASVADIQKAVASGDLTYERLVQMYLERIEAFDRNGPKLNSVLYVNPRAVETARSLDEERRTKGLRSPLHGIPVAIKDNVDTADMPTTGGSQSFAGSVPAADATIVRKLREAGAIIFIKTNMDELARVSQGLSSLGGQILNPYDVKRNPGGSSGGTAVAVSAGFATVGIGTETGVSVRSPASNSGIVGIVGTQGLVSRAGVMPVSFTQDRVGVHGKSVADAALLLSSIRGFDPDDLVTRESFTRAADQRTYTDLAESGLAGARLGVLRDLFREGAEFAPINKLIETEIAMLRNQRAILVDGLRTGVDLIGLMPFLRVNDFEMGIAFDSYLRRRGTASPVKSFADLVAGGKYLTSLQRSLQQVVEVRSLDSNPEYLARLEQQRTVRQLLIDLMDRHRLDALVYPYKSLSVPLVGVPDSGTRDNPISAVTGLPAIVIPAGFDSEGLPISLEMLGRPFSERLLIRLAHAYEKAGNHRKPPNLPR